MQKISCATTASWKAQQRRNIQEQKRHIKKWEKFEDGYSIPVKSWCENCEEGAVQQAVNLAHHPVLVHHVALMPDAHQGYGMPIGGVVAAKGAVIPAAVGVDIGCGMIACETDIPAERFADMSFRRAFQEKLKERIPVGEGVSHREGATSAKLDEIGVIPGSMGTASYIVRGLGNPDSFQSCSHGAGRRMSRIAASTNLTAEECDRAMDGIVCERWKPYRGYGKAKGRLDLSEAPQAYKDIESVIDAERDLVEPLVRLVPLASLKG